MLFFKNVVVEVAVFTLEDAIINGVIRSVLLRSHIIKDVPANYMKHALAV